MTGIVKEHNTDFELLNWSIYNLLSNKICLIFSFLAVCMYVCIYSPLKQNIKYIITKTLNKISHLKINGKDSTSKAKN